ncbi:hypothetical protein ACEPAF_2080 [Sanghuangporus sanghuang]
MAKDIAEILDTEKLENVVSISHDWGSCLNSRLLTYHPERILASTFFAMGCYQPSGRFNIDALNTASIEKYGYAKFGYWKFFSKDGADKVTLGHVKSFFTLLYSRNDLLTQHWCPEGALEEWLLADKKPWVLIIRRRKAFLYLLSLEEWFRGSLLLVQGNYFISMLVTKQAHNDRPLLIFPISNTRPTDIPFNAYFIKQPVFFGATLRDPTSTSAENIGILKALCPNHTIRSFETGHWVLHERPTEVNVNEELKWLDGLRLEGPKKLNL